MTKEQMAKLREEIAKAAGEAQKLMDEHKGKAMPENVAKQVDTLLTEAKEKQDEVDTEIKAQAEAQALEQKNRERLNGVNDFLKTPSPIVPHDTSTSKQNPSVPVQDPIDTDPVVGYMTLGQAFVMSQTYLSGLKRGFIGANDFPAKLHITADGRHVALRRSQAEAFNQAKMQIKDITDSTAGDLVIPQRLTELMGDLKRPLRVRNLLSVYPSSSPTVEYVETNFTQSAAEVAVSSPKAESDMTATKQTATAKEIAHYVRVHNSMMKDYGQLQSKIDTELVYGLDLREDYQLIWGDGTGANLTGILNTGSIQDYDTAIGDVRGSVDDTILDKVRRAITNVVTEYLPADGVVIHPIDWETAELLKGTDDRYVWVVVPQGGEPRIWRLPVVESVSLQDPEGSGERHAIVGAFKLAAALFDVDNATVEVGYAGDDFIENFKRVRAEKRVIFPVYYPQGFIDITIEEAAS